MAECDDLAELAELLTTKRAAAAGVHAELPGKIANRVTPPFMALPQLTAEQIAAREREQNQREADRAQYARHDRWRGLVRARGSRYGDCRLATFDTEHDSQKGAVELLAAYCREIGDRIADGEGIILFGPKGTGKDHLAMAVARVAVLSGKHVTWQNGMDLFGDIRDAMDRGDAERALVHRLVTPDVLYLSDPLPPIGNLTEFQASMLFRILDGRYSRRRPVWCTVNVSSGDELDRRIGPQNGDRLRDGTLAIFCDWPSHRRVRP